MKYNQLTDLELLREVLIERKDTYIAETLLDEYGNLAEAILHSTPQGLAALDCAGLGEKKKSQIIAIQELVNRLMTVDWGRGNYKISSPSDAASLMMNKLKFSKREEAWIICLNQKNYVMDCFLLSIGGVSSAIIDPRCIYDKPLRMGCCSGIILIHNHNSHFAGDPTTRPLPSPEDVSVCKTLKEIGMLLKIPLVDSLIIGMNRYVSLKEEGYL